MPTNEAVAGDVAVKRASIFGGLALVAFLVGCGPGPDVILPGERLDIRDGSEGAAAEAEQGTRPITLPGQDQITSWSHRAGSAIHRAPHARLNDTLSLAFSSSIGEGNGRRARITADPVSDGARIFTLDARAGVMATSTGGASLWSRDLTPVSDNTRDASGGGLAVSGGVLYVTTGFGELTALNAETGAEIWTQDLDAPGGSAPTVRGDLVYVVSRDSTAWAVEASTGRIRWTLQGTPSETNFGGGAGAAVTEDLAIFPMPSGEVLAAFAQGGLRRWSSIVTGQRRGRAAATISDIAGDPVVAGDRVYVGNVSGRVAALNIANGERIWTATEGTVSPVVPAGGSVFLINDLGELIRMDADTGAVIWRSALPQAEQRRGLFSRTADGFAHYGPILAGGRLVVASSDGALRFFDPVSGSLSAEAELPGGAASHPIIVGGALYVVSQRGDLLAFR